MPREILTDEEYFRRYGRRKPGCKTAEGRARQVAAVKALGSDHFRELGKKGGATTRDTYGSELYAAYNKLKALMRVEAKLLELKARQAAALDAELAALEAELAQLDAMAATQIDTSETEEKQNP